MEEEEGHILADLSILEFYLHRSIKLRLGAFGKKDEESRSELQQAHLQTVIVSDMIKTMMNMIGGSFDDIPLDPVLRMRLNFGGVLGMLLFSGAETWEKRMEEMSQALPVLIQLTTASRCKALHKPLFELKKIVLLWSAKNNMEAIEEFESIFGDSLSPEATEQGKQALLNEEDFKKTRKEVLSDLNLQHFGRLVVEGMREAYEGVEAPLIARMSKSQLNSMAASNDAMDVDKAGEKERDKEESQPSVYTQAPYMTQIPTQEPATQTFHDTQSSMFSDKHVLETEVTLPASTEATNATCETLELLTPSPAVLPQSTPDSVPVPQSAPTVIPLSTQEGSLSITLETPKATEEPDNQIETKDQESDEDSEPDLPFQPATQMPFDDGNADLELEDDHPEKDPSHDNPTEDSVIPTMSTGISILKDEPEESSASEESTDEEEQIINRIPFEFFSRLLEYCDEDPKEFFSTPEDTIDRLYERYQAFKEEKEADKELPSLESLLPRESSPIRPTVKKRVVFESEADFEEPPALRVPILKKSKKSMLLPNESSKKVDWDSLAPSSPIAKENDSLDRNSHSAEDDSSRPRQKQTKGRRPFTEEETANLIDGVRKYGRKWAVILTCYKFNDRTSVDLKDKARNLAKKGVINMPA